MEGLSARTALLCFPGQALHGLADDRTRSVALDKCADGIAGLWAGDLAVSPS